MSILEWIQIATALASAIAAALTWAAKLRWSKEFSDAKDATISAKESEIQSLRTQIEILNSYISPEILNHLRETIKEFEKMTGALKSEIKVLEGKEQEKDEQISKLLPNQDENKARIKQLEKERQEFNNKIRELEVKINDKKVKETAKVISDIEEDLETPKTSSSSEKLSTYINAAAVISGGLALLNAMTKDKK